MFFFQLTLRGDDCGIIQLSAVAVNLQPKKLMVEFDKYVKPAYNAQCSEAAMTIHGIQPTDERINGIETVRKEFVVFIEGHLPEEIIAQITNQGSLLHKFGNGDWVAEIIATDIHEEAHSHSTTIFSSNKKK